MGDTVGIRRPRMTPEIPRPTYDGTENDVQWVEISGNMFKNMFEKANSGLNLSILFFTPPMLQI